MSEKNGLTEEQKNYLQGFAMGRDVARAVRGLPVLSGSGGTAGSGSLVSIGPSGVTVASARAAGPEQLQFEAQDRFLAQGKTLVREEQAKRSKDPLCFYDQINAHARDGVFPKDTDVFLYKY